MTKEINFDMDGTFVNLYGVDNWIEYLDNFDSTLYEIAKPLFNMSAFARAINRLQRNGWKINIISWSSKYSTADFDVEVKNAKMKWLAKHLPSVKWDAINVVAYGEEKYKYGSGILFDDEQHNREVWTGTAYDVNNILDILNSL